MKKLSPPPISKFNLAISLLLLVQSVGLFPKILHAQSIECGTELPTGAIQILLDNQPAIQVFEEAQSRQIQATQNVPVRFTSISGPSGGILVSQTDVDFALARMNEAFAAASLNFVQCGDINYIYDDRINTKDPSHEDTDGFTSSFSYTSGAIEVYSKTSQGPPISVVPLIAYQAGNPNIDLNPTKHNNYIKLPFSPSAQYKTTIHEMGHIFGLLHTHHVVQNYNVPLPGDNTLDYPYPVIGPNGQIVPDWWGRELVIRNSGGPQTFSTRNYDFAGDLIADTPADCNRFLAKVLTFADEQV
jgi:hypothetical protein